MQKDFVSRATRHNDMNNNIIIIIIIVALGLSLSLSLSLSTTIITLLWLASCYAQFLKGQIFEIM